jgi:hypothetical protein
LSSQYGRCPTPITTACLTHSSRPSLVPGKKVSETLKCPTDSEVEKILGGLQVMLMAVAVQVELCRQGES